MAETRVPERRPNPRLSNLIEQGGKSRDYSRVISPKGGEKTTSGQTERAPSGSGKKK
ncbi:MAG TPA: hypothetical protein VIR57_02550 [Chloroflexota bacterium]|jgi:hypothetical protein